MYEIITYFGIWFLAWILGWAGLYFLPNKYTDYLKNYIIVSIYFILIGMICIYIFKDYLGDIYRKVSYIPVFILIIFFIINFLEVFFSRKFLTKPVKFIEKYSTVDFLKLDYRFLVSKSFDIFYQQVLIIVLILLMYKTGMNIFLISIAFAVLFGFGHIPILRVYEGFFGFFYLIASILSSFLFPYLILTYDYGFVYTYIAHWLFYTNSGILFWIIKREKRIAKEMNLEIGEIKDIKTSQITEVKTITDTVKEVTKEVSDSVKDVARDITGGEKK